MNTIGSHVVADVWAEQMPKMKDLKKAIAEALKISKMTIVGECEHLFGEDAFTYLALLAESHFSVHTFPESNYISFDCYTCGNEGDPIACVSFILSSISVEKSEMKIIRRGAIK